MEVFMTERQKLQYINIRERANSKVIGHKFGRFTVLSYSHTEKSHKYFLCKCDCGEEKVVSISHLKRGGIKSCGCYWQDIKHSINFKHGGRYTKLYNIWCGMKERCSNPNCEAYKNYGARGISVCKEWIDDFFAFENWANENGYKQGLQIDRINNNSGYSPDNCRFVTPKENNMNRRNTRYITYNGETKTLLEWADKIGISADLLAIRIDKLHWSVEKALNPKTYGSRLITYNGETKTLAQWGRILGFSSQMLRYRLEKLKMPAEQAFSVPKKDESLINRGKNGRYVKNEQPNT